jgi:hypothetical protein
MKIKLIFEIPGDEAAIKLIETIPSSWAWLDGVLSAPENLLNAGFVLAETGYNIGRFHNATIIGHYDNKTQKRATPDIGGILVDQKLPEFILFDEAGYDDNFNHLNLAKEIAIGYIKRFYRGVLFFFKDCYDNNKYDNSARCDLFLGRIEHGETSRIELAWNDKYRGKQEDIDPILTVCRNLGLKELLPKED